VSLLLACAGTPAFGYTTLPLDLAAKVFGARPSASAPDVSPDGDKIVYIAAGPGTANVVRVLDLKTKQTTDVIASAGKPDSLNWCEFASEEWLVCHYRGDVPYRTAILGMSRLIAIDIKTKQTHELGVKGRYDEAATIQQNDGFVISYPSDGGPSVIMARNYVMRANVAEGLGETAPPVSVGVDRIALDTMKVAPIDPARPYVADLLTEPNGTPRVMGRAAYDLAGQMTGVEQFQFRPRGSVNWLNLGSYDSRAETGMIPLMVDAASDQVYFLQKKNGRQALYSEKLEPNSTITEVAENPQYDIDGTIKITHDGPVVGYAYTADRPQVVYFDPSYTKLVSDLEKAVPDAPMIDIAGSSRDGNRLLIHAASDDDPGAYYVFDKQAKTLDFAMENRDALANVPLSPVRRVDVPTADGHTVPAYLTMPEGHAANGPAVVLPHGGPSSRDALGFDWLAQFLASRGYAVIQPNYRGSAGYGDQFQGDNAFKDWRTAINDIGASADYLVKEKIADAGRLAIVGWSYGGYAALQSAVTTPAKYNAVVAIAPVTDLSRLGRDDQELTTSQLTEDFVGKGQNLRDGSPLQHAAMIKAPVLLVHGDLDSNVRVWHSRLMQKALQSSGDQVELLEFKGLNHQLEDGDARVQMLTKIGQLLDRTIGH
jgi:dipeptidyl aminopeptidase/acylaminoacyl peptidase